MMPFVGSLLEKRGIDDAVGAVAVHGAVGLWSLVAVGIFASGYPNVVAPRTCRSAASWLAPSRSQRSASSPDT